MPDKPLKPARAHFCREYTTSGHNGAEAYRVAYPGCKSGHKQAASLLLTSIDVQQEISRIEAETAKKLDLSRAGQHEKLQDAYNIAEKAKNPAAMTGAIREQNEMLGFHRDKAPNQEKVDEILARMTDEEIATRRIVAKMRTDALAGPKLSTDKEIA